MMTTNRTASALDRGHDDLADGLKFETYTAWLHEIENQPSWRGKADREMEYVDGNQLDAEILQKQRDIGMPPAIEPLIGPAIDAVTGLEAKTRTDWRVAPDPDVTNSAEFEDTGKALNYKLNQAERHSKADKACSDAFLTQFSVGVGWVEVARESNPFKYNKRCRAVHRNEIFWDWLSVEPDLSDARYLVRRRWTDADQVALKFKAHKDLIMRCMGRWSDFEVTTDGGSSTDLSMAWDHERGWSIEEMQWRDSERARVCLFEVWYRKWLEITVIKSPDGRVVEVDETNEAHMYAIGRGLAKPTKVIVSKVFVSYWMGPHKLHDGPSPYPHNHFPYVPFWGKREDRTMVPYGAVRGMVYLQDNVNSAISKIRWGLSSVRTTRTKGAVAMTDAQFRQQISRVDADVILNAEHMAQPGATFKVERDFQLSEQQYRMLQDSRMGIQRSSGITAGFAGQQGNATSGVQEATQVEQTTQALATMFENFRYARTMVGELLLAMEIEDIGMQQTDVLIKGNAVTPDRMVTLNIPTDDGQGIQYLTNDVQRARLKVSLSDVPSTSSHRAQQLSAMSEAFKSMPVETQLIALPHLLNLMDIPDKDEIIKAIQDSKQNKTDEQIEQMIQQALKDAGLVLKERELELKYSPERMRAEIEKIVSETVKNGVQAAFAAMQAGQVIATMPQVAPVADVVMQASGYRAPSPGGDDPNFPQPQISVPPAQVHENTSPQLPPVPSDGTSAMQGIETPTTADNITGVPA